MAEKQTDENKNEDELSFTKNLQVHRNVQY